MMKNTVLFLLMGFAFLFSLKTKAQTPGPDTYITVTDDLSDEQLIKDVLINDPCAFVDNVQGTTGTDFSFSCDGIAYFTNTNPAFPIEEGIVLMTDDASSAAGPYTGTYPCGGGQRWPGDPQLSAYINDALNEDFTYNDASILEFEFTPVVDSISFNFVFASSEYGAYQCSTFADPFAFFLENADTGEIVNLAIVPGTSDPISVLTINDEDYGTGCGSENEAYFADYYGTAPGPGTTLPAAQAPFNFHGSTILMTASGEVVPFQKYRMKMAIQNTSDDILDTAVFIEAGSFNIGTDQFLGPDITATSDLSACEGETIELTVGDLANAIGTENIDIVWTFNGEVIPGSEGKTTLIVSESGCYGVTIESPNFTDCAFEDVICVEFKVTPEIPEAIDGTLVFCGEVQKTLVATPTNLSELNVISYVWYKDGVELTGSTGSTLDVTEPGVYTVIVEEVNCPATATITIEKIDFSVDLGDDVEICDQNSVVLTPTITDEDSNPPMDITQVQYSWSTGETTQSIEVTESGTYTVQATYNGCTAEDTVEVVIRQLPEISITEDFKKCINEVSLVEVDVLSGDESSFTYTWYRDGGVIANQNQNTIEVTEEGTYSVDVYEVGAPAGCITTDNVVVSYYDNANCIIPQGISPNGDEFNQRLDLTFLNERTGISSIEIFNRHGRSVYSKTGGYTNEWEGQTDGGDELTTGTFYYVIKLNGVDEQLKKQVLTGWIYINREIM